MVGRGMTHQPVDASRPTRPVATVTERPSGSGSTWRRISWVVRPSRQRAMISSAEAAVPPEKVPCMRT